MTMNKFIVILSILSFVIILVAGFFVFSSYIYNEKQTDTVGVESYPDNSGAEGGTTEPQICDGDAMMCPDGSSVGRSGPGCVFADCPTPHATSARVTTYMDGTATALNVSVTPHAIISDSRCPIDVTCISAGTIEILTVLSTKTSHGEHKLTLGKPQVFGDYVVTLVAVTPDKKQAKSIPDSSFRFTFEIAKRI